MNEVGTCPHSADSQLGLVGQQAEGSCCVHSPGGATDPCCK